MDRLNVKALAIAGGVPVGPVHADDRLVCVVFNWGNGFVAAMSSVYIGFRPTFLGGIIGAVWGFFDGAVAGAIIAWVYNGVAKKK
jgi:hypothetical protein